MNLFWGLMVTRNGMMVVLLSSGRERNKERGEEKERQKGKGKGRSVVVQWLLWFDEGFEVGLQEEEVE